MGEIETSSVFQVLCITLEVTQSTNYFATIMSACLPLSDSLRIWFQFQQQPVSMATNSCYPATLQHNYPKVHLGRDNSRASSTVSSTPVLPDFFELTWGEYCNLVQSKPIALNIITFRDCTYPPSDINQDYRQLNASFTRPSQILLNSFQGRSTLSTYHPNNLNLPAGSMRHQQNNAYNPTPSFHFPRGRQEIGTTAFLGCSNHYQNISGQRCNQYHNTTNSGPPMNDGFNTQASTAPGTNSFQGFQYGLVSTSTTHRSQQVTSQPSLVCDSLSTHAEGRSSSSSALPNSSSADYTPPPEQSEESGVVNDTYSDDNMNEYISDSEDRNYNDITNGLSPLFPVTDPITPENTAEAQPGLS